MAIPNVLSIAGSDPSGGAGIQADLKAFSALESYGMAAVVGLTAQNTCGVTAVQMLPAHFVEAQLHSIFDDIEVSAIKIGMLGTAEMIELVSKTLKDRYDGPLVLDPVMRAKSGDSLLDDDAVAAMRTELLPLATVVTPNLPEAEALTGINAVDRASMNASADALVASGVDVTILLKGGALSGNEAPDLLAQRDVREWLEAPRIATQSVHGAGCTLSAGIAAYLGHGHTATAACRLGKSFITRAIRAANELSVGQGHGPTHPLHDLWATRRS